jgi:uncharacterized protein (TIGR00661 family)
MANILYGVNGEGAGHSTRSKEVLRFLKRQGHKVHVASFDRGLKNLSDEFEVTEIHGLRLTYVNNRVRYGRTLTRNLLSSPKAAKSSRELMRLAEHWKIDAVVTDFEPVTCHVGHRRHLPVITIDNQHAITNCEVEYPREYRKDAAATRLVTRLMTPRADANLVISFFPAELKRKNTYLFTPILREEILRATPTAGEHVLVYVTSPSLRLGQMIEAIRCPFIAYGFGREGVSGNVIYKKPSQQEFMNDLVGCKAIVANAGFSLISEALHLGKPYLAMPVARQFEQIFNAHYLASMGYGAFWKELEKEKIESFLFNIERYRENLRGYPRQDNSALFAKLDELLCEFTSTKAKAASK